MSHGWSLAYLGIRSRNAQAIVLIEEVKTHIQKHKVAYGVGTGMIIAGITYVIMRGTVLHSGAGVGILHSEVTNTASPFSFGNKQSINIITVLESQKGHPGWPIRCIETGQKWLSQGAGAEALDVSKSMMSSHISKNIPDNIHGLHFERMSLVPI